MDLRQRLCNDECPIFKKRSCDDCSLKNPPVPKCIDCYAFGTGKGKLEWPNKTSPIWTCKWMEIHCERIYNAGREDEWDKW